MLKLRLAPMLMTMIFLPGCLLFGGTPVSGGEGEGELLGEGEGDGVVAEGEGDGPNEGEGDGGGPNEGEGEGVVGEGEGEGVVGEGEGEGIVGEGEGEPPLVGACTRDAECTAGQLCRFALVGGLRQRQCQPTPATGGDNGATCTTDAQCLHGYCAANGLCAEPCVIGTDCAGLGQRCLPTGAISFDDGTTFVGQACARDNTLPVLACTSDAVCAPTGRLCNDFVDAGGNNLTLKCGFPGTGADLYGSCTGQFFFEADVCVSGLCTAAANGTGLCTRACATGADCGGGICTGRPFTNIAGNYCAQPCEVTSQCPAGQACRTRIDPAGTALDAVCDTPASPTCETGLVFAGGVCGTLCRNGNDCPANRVCEIATITSGTATEDLLLCQTPQ